MLGGKNPPNIFMIPNFPADRQFVHSTKAQAEIAQLSPLQFFGCFVIVKTQREMPMYMAEPEEPYRHLQQKRSNQRPFFRLYIGFRSVWKNVTEAFSWIPAADLAEREVTNDVRYQEFREITLDDHRAQDGQSRVISFLCGRRRRFFFAQKRAGKSRSTCLLYHKSKLKVNN